MGNDGNQNRAPDPPRVGKDLAYVVQILLKTKDDDEASKWNLAQLKAHFERVGINFSTVLYRIKDVIIKTLQSVEPHIVSTI